jgi:site-specific recombinase XerC
MNHPLAFYLKRFFSHYLPVQKGLSPHTLAAYRDAVKLLFCYLADTLTLSLDTLTVEAITAARVSDFLDDLEQVRGCRTVTRNARLAAIRSLFAFIAREEPVLLPQCQPIRAIPLKRAEHKTVEYLEESEMQAVLDAVDLEARTGIRDQALLLILYNTGARVSEIEVPRAQRRPLAKPLADVARRYPVRREAMARAFQTGVYTMQEIADYFGVHYSTVSRAVRRLETNQRGRCPKPPLLAGEARE